MRPKLLVSVIGLLVIGRNAGAQQAPSAIAGLSWLGGCWRQSNPTTHRVIDEQWMAPRGGAMLGMARTVRDDSVVEFEHLRIFARNGHAIYHAEPSGQAPAEFDARAVTDTMVTFENPSHDFPQRIVYRRRGTDSLVARIEGKRNGRVRGIDFPYGRVACGSNE